MTSSIEASETNETKERRSPNGVTKSLVGAVVIALFVITFVVQAFQIPSGSMERTLLIGDYVLVDKIHFGRGGAWDRLMPYREIQRGDIVVFHYPIDPAQHFVKRVIGLPGDHLRLRESTVFINGQPLHEEYAIHTVRAFDLYRDNFPMDMDTTGNINTTWHAALARHVQHGELVVPKDMFFVMGDNRDQSSDSRYWGFVPRQAIVGQPLVVYLSVREQPVVGLNEPKDRLAHSARLLTHFWELPRWNRIFHRIR